MSLLGLDLGTSSLKAVLLNEAGRVVGRGESSYPTSHPQPGWAEQDPERWWRACAEAARQALTGNDPAAVAGIGLSGQMHGVVLAGGGGEPLHPAVIWADSRSAPFLPEYEAALPAERRDAILANPLAAGFAGPTLLWFRDRLPQVLGRARHALQPKDWLRLRLTGAAASEPTDASATLLFDVPRRTWSAEVTGALRLPHELLPPLVESGAAAGALARPAADALGFPPGIPVAAGAADQAAAAVGNGIVAPGKGQLLLGSGGQLLKVSAGPVSAAARGVHLFCHAPADRWYRLAAILDAGLAVKWARRALALATDEFFEAASAAPPGAGGLVFLPYLSGERTPRIDARARGAFLGLSSEHGPAELARATLEGVTFALRLAMEAMSEPPDALRLAGGGARNSLWRQIVADALEVPVESSLEEDASAWGAALLAGLAVDAYSGWEDTVACSIRGGATLEPSPDAPSVRAAYHRFTELKAALDRAR